MEKVHRGVAAGSVVQARGEQWRVVHARRFGVYTFVTLDGQGSRPRPRITLLSPFDTLVAAAPMSLRRAGPRLAAKTTMAALSRSRPGRRLWAALDASFDVLPWQLAPALAVLNGATRVLLADAVGLGKTVQAGLILAELSRRGLLERALVLTPPALREAWAGELRKRFNLEAAVIDQPALLAQQRLGAVGANPWARVPVVVSSIDLVKRADIRAAVEEQAIDVLVVDEAHHATPGSDRGAVVARLAAQVPWLVLASATPHSGDARAYRWLLDCGRTGHPREPAMAVFRRTHDDAGFATARATHVLPVAPTAAERQLHDALLDYGRLLWRGPFGAHPGVQLVAITLARRATSCAAAAEHTLTRRLQALAHTAPAPRMQPALPWEELDAGDSVDALDPRWLALRGLHDVEDECLRLQALITLARDAAASPSKFRRLARFLSCVREPVIVFSEFRDTLEACLPHIAAAGPAVMLHGGMDAGERGRVLNRFLGGGARVLLATDVAGEGLNLQGASRVVVTVEWPWTPQRLEQRVGRVDRLGQTRRVHAVHLTAQGSFEDSVVARVLARRGRADRDLAATTAAGEGPLASDGAEGDLAARIFGEQQAPRPAASTPLASTSIEPDVALEAERIVFSRRLAAQAGLVDDAARWSAPRHAGDCRRLAVAVEVSARSVNGRLEWSVPIALTVTLAACPTDRGGWARACRAIAADARVHDIATAAANESAATADWQPVLRRLAALRHARRAGPRVGVQASLFDRRALRAAEARQAVIARLDAYQEWQSAWLAAGNLAVESRVIAVLPIRQARRR